MLNLKVVGAGAAGNKAAIALIEKGFNKDNVTLINSTSKDLPDDYKDNAIIFGSNPSSLGGCGKERNIGKKLIIEDMKHGNVNIDSVVDPTTNAVIIVSSSTAFATSSVSGILPK